jgi:hypothetical protein
MHTYVFWQSNTFGFLQKGIEIGGFMAIEKGLDVVGFECLVS